MESVQSGQAAPFLLQSGLPPPPPGDLPNPGIEPMSLMSPTLAGGFLTTSTTWEAFDWESPVLFYLAEQQSEIDLVHFTDLLYIWLSYCLCVTLLISLVVQSLSRAQLFETPWTAACQASLSITNFRSWLKLVSIVLVMPSSHLILCCPSSPLAFNLSQHQVFSNDLALRIRWPKYWSFNFSINPSNEYPGLISSRTDWVDLLAVQGTLESLLQHYNQKTSILWCSAFFMAQLSHAHMTTGKTIALTRWIFVLGKNGYIYIICMAESLYCPPKSISTLLIYYTPYKIKSEKKNFQYILQLPSFIILSPSNTRTWLFTIFIYNMFGT